MVISVCLSSTCLFIDLSLSIFVYHLEYIIFLSLLSISFYHLYDSVISLSFLTMDAHIALNYVSFCQHLLNMPQLVES